MTEQHLRGSGRARGRASGLLRDSGVIALAIVVMNVSTYAFQMVAARLLGPEQYGGVAGLMALLMVVAVVQLGLQATCARRISADPDHVAQIERVMLGVTYRAAWATGLLLLVLSPLVWKVLRLDSITPALLVAVAAVPLTIMGGQAGVLQGERRWAPLAALYLALGVPRLVVGATAIAIRPSEGAAMLGVALALFAPAAVGWWALRRPRDPGEDSAANAVRPVLRETFHASIALLAFFVLSNADIVVARNVLEFRDAGLYAGGLILTKAVLFLPQFVVVVAFPALSTVSERRRALLRSLGLVAFLGVCAVVGSIVLADLAVFFIGGDQYAGAKDQLWLFAVLGTLLSALQLLTYSVLARQDTRTGYLVWVSVAALLGLSLVVDSLTALVLTVVAIDSALLVALLAVSLRRMNDDVPAAPAAEVDQPQRS